jgi:hypothetical protein
MQEKRPAPDPEWVQMYRQGIPSPKIAAGAGVAASTVRYHLTIAVKQDPGLRAAHQAARPAPKPSTTAAGRQNLQDILDLYRTENRLPTRHTKKEKALASWLKRQREAAENGTLAPAYAEALDEIPGWRNPPNKQADDAARWDRRLTETAAWMAAGNQLPRHNKTDDREERTLGVWLHTQRIDHRAGKLTPTKEARLNEAIPGWRHGRSKGRPRRPQTEAEPLR